MSSPSHSNPWLGRSLGDNQRYRLDRRLGGGGMGDVFLATDTRVGQQVALKLLKDNLVESPEMIQRFEHEIAICAALHNDHIVKIMDSGVTPEGYPFYVMEYLRGITLGELLRAEPRLSLDRTAKIVSQVCNGLLQAHQGVNLPEGEHIEAVIHRDLKPDNIFLQPTDLGEWVKIVDFGIAKIRYKDRQNQTLTHTFLGTLRYASPEQMMGDRELDARSDIYSLGVILYEMLSGADPFGFNIQSRPMSEASWIIAHTSEQPIALRSQPGCDRLPASLEAVTRRCLEKNPDLRFASVAEFNLALQATLNTPTIEEEQTIVRPRPEATPAANNDETIANAISPPPLSAPTAINPLIIPSQLETIRRAASPVEPALSANLAETIAQPISPQPSGSSTPTPQPIPSANLAETIAQPISPQPSGSPVAAISNQSAPPFTPPVVEGKTQAQPHPSVPPSNPQTPTAAEMRSSVEPAQHKTSGLKLAIGSVVGLTLIGGIYILTQSRPAPVVTNPAGSPTESSPPTAPANQDNTATAERLAVAIKSLDERKIQAGDEISLQSAIDSASQVSQSSPDYATARAIGADAARLSEAIKLANRGKLTEAIAAAKKISSQSPIFKKAQAYIEEWKKV
ncbi:serine/threonine protein kinase [Chamaesiphon minutus]|uniref:Serine/threonine protein kinase n=1 Tax=Chamaesiphon minutus (strain ATCC 27169 / PCC 6605) TaxID=1173020 RepID=K9U8E1_CHAP6|nr:serine/threonine-protein kinase [Chamaesiphon minutus]AFY91327.1 serine/threonine protein kinase [Chamaesiphon minutus PCC 6605]